MLHRRDVLANFLAGKVGGAPLSVPEGHAGIPVEDHRLGLAQLRVPARKGHGAGVSYQSESAGRGRGSAKVWRRGMCQGSDWRRSWGGYGLGCLLLLAKVVGDLEDRLALTCRREGKRPVSATSL